MPTQQQSGSLRKEGVMMRFNLMNKRKQYPVVAFENALRTEATDYEALILIRAMEKIRRRLIHTFHTERRKHPTKPFIRTDIVEGYYAPSVRDAISRWIETVSGHSTAFGRILSNYSAEFWMLSGRAAKQELTKGNEVVFFAAHKNPSGRRVDHMTAAESVLGNVVRGSDGMYYKLGWLQKLRSIVLTPNGKR